MLSLSGVSKIESAYLKTINTYGQRIETKFWGTLNPNVTDYQVIDDSTRALCSLSKNTYDDTLLKSTLSYGNSIDDNIIVGTTEKVTCRINTITNPAIEFEKTIWSGSINPEVTAADLKNSFGYVPDRNGSFTEDNLGPTTLFSLIDVRQIVPQGNYYLRARSQTTVSVNEQLSI